MSTESITFGPVPSRRLGRSLGVNNIPAKTCSYGCVYCQVGRTTCMEIQPQAFYASEFILKDIGAKLAKIRSAGAGVDYVTFVSDGEPTLDIHLKTEIQGVKALGLKTAVISNASLIWRQDVRESLAEADWVSLKMDAADKKVWRRINRPHGSLRLQRILEGAQLFSKSYAGKLVTETMLVRGLNDAPDQLSSLSLCLQQLNPAVAYLSVPTRPPAEPRVRPPREIQIHRAYEIMCTMLPNVALNISYEGDDFQPTGEAALDLLNITAVHPMREAAVLKFLKQAGAGKELLTRLVSQNRLSRIEYDGNVYYLRPLPNSLL
ncbi:MAG: radical SAM protein [Deltaproteobacteria bacterium]